MLCIGSLTITADYLTIVEHVNMLVCFHRMCSSNCLVISLQYPIISYNGQKIIGLTLHFAGWASTFNGWLPIFLLVKSKLLLRGFPEPAFFAG